MTNLLCSEYIPISDEEYLLAAKKSDISKILDHTFWMDHETILQAIKNACKRCDVAVLRAILLNFLPEELDILMK